jgi:biopolymer transport protein ExbD
MKRFDTINVIPLIDVMLVLLAIVLTTASFIVKDQLNIKLPETQNTQSYQPNTQLKTVDFVIDMNNQIFVDKKKYTIKNLQSLLRTLPKEQNITLQVDQQADFGTFVEIIDLLKGESLQNITILTEADTKDAS